MKIKRIIGMVLLVAVACTSAVFGFTACGADNELICGVTLFEPMNYKDANGNWTGFDTEFAQAVGEELGMTVKFQEIAWSSKYLELNSGNISCIWNGFTANSSDEGKARSEYVDFSYSYMLNQQCVVVKAANLDQYTNEASLVGKKGTAEEGSAGDDYAKKAVGDSGTFIGASSQVNTLPEVSGGQSDFAVIDVLLAKELVGKGDYQNLAIVTAIELNAEVYAIGFKKGSSLTAKVNGAIEKLNESGKLKEIAKKYKLENSLLVDKAFKS